VDKAVSNVADMDVVAFEVLFKDHEIAVKKCGIGKVVDQQIKARPGRHAEDGGQPQGNRVACGQDDLLCLALGPSVERDRVKGRLFSTKDVAGLGAVAAVRRRVDDQLFRAANTTEHRNGVTVG
jgi:hypothetical protein